MQEKFEKILQLLSPEDMPNEDLRDLAILFGVPFVITLVREYGGAHFYIPKGSIFKKQIELFVKNNFNGHNSRELANACGCSTRKINKIVHKSEHKTTTYYPVKQLTLPL